MVVGFIEFALHGSLAAVWFWMLLLIGLVWLKRHLDLNRASDEPILGPGDADGDTPLPKLTVLVAGKEEEANIGRCLEGLLAQDYPDLQIVAANDRSEDRTGALMDEFAQRDARVTAVHVESLPEGWGGKNHAMHTAMEHAAGEYLLFTDADCRFHNSKLLQAAVRSAQRDGVEFLSVLPDLDADSFWERVVQPPAGGVMVFWFPPEKVNNPNSPRAYANGAFMLMTRAAYDRIGGHAAVKAALNEDMHFARLIKQHGIRSRVIRGGGMYSVRMYVGLGQIWRGWTRIFYASFGTLPRLIASVLFLGIFSLWPLLSLALAPLAGPAALGIALAAGLVLVIQQTVLWRFYRLSNTPPWWALTWHLGAGLCLAITCNAMRRHFGARTQWRGTVYQGGH